MRRVISTAGAALALALATIACGDDGPSETAVALCDRYMKERPEGALTYAWARTVAAEAMDSDEWGLGRTLRDLADAEQAGNEDEAARHFRTFLERCGYR